MRIEWRGRRRLREEGIREEDKREKVRGEGRGWKDGISEEGKMEKGGRGIPPGRSVETYLYLWSSLITNLKYNICKTLEKRTPVPNHTHDSLLCTYCVL